jgi:toxin YoeB
MKIAFEDNGWEDYAYWLANDRRKLKTVNKLIKAILSDPYTGVGKPEELKYALQGAWSRRIDLEHRLVYVIDGDYAVIISARHHY